jgi:hypothetical protein
MDGWFRRRRRWAAAGAACVHVLTAVAAGQAQLPWWDRAAEARVGMYWIKTDLPAADANALGRHLNIMYEEYSRRLASLPPRAPEALNVLIFASQDDYVFTLRTRYGISAGGTGGLFFVQGPTMALAFWTGELPRRRVEHVLQHEGFHQFAYSRFGGDLPLWVNEGLAEFFGESIVVGRSLIIGQASPRVVSAVTTAVELDQIVPFRDMLAITPLRWGALVREGDARLHYQQAWSMVHFLVYADPNGDGAPDYVTHFERYLHKLNAGVPDERAFIEVFGEDVEAFETRWKAYALKARPGAFAAALERIEFLAEGALELRRRDRVPASLDELRAGLREIGFTYARRQHAQETILSAADDALFEIPRDGLCREQPVFVAARADTRSLSRREKHREAESPRPVEIETSGLQPRNLAVEWRREGKPGAFRYEIVVR